MNPYRRAHEVEVDADVRQSTSRPLHDWFLGAGLAVVLVGSACVVLPAASALCPVGSAFVVAGVLLRDRAERRHVARCLQCRVVRAAGRPCCPGGHDHAP